MIIFIVQTALLIAIAFVLGVLFGAAARVFIGSEPAPAVPVARPASPPPTAQRPAPAPAEPAPSVAAKTEADEPPPEERPKPAPTTVEPGDMSVATEAPPTTAPPPTTPAPALADAAIEPVDAGAPDDLKKIKGIGPQNEKKLNAVGITHYAQIAAWTEDDARQWGERLAFAGRIEREDWVGQAKILAAGGTTEFSRRKG